MSQTLVHFSRVVNEQIQDCVRELCAPVFDTTKGEIVLVCHPLVYLHFYNVYIASRRHLSEYHRLENAAICRRELISRCKDISDEKKTKKEAFCKADEEILKRRSLTSFLYYPEGTEIGETRRNNLFAKTYSAFDFAAEKSVFGYLPYYRQVSSTNFTNLRKSHGTSPFSVVRLGCRGSETELAYYHKNKRPLASAVPNEQEMRACLHNNAGVYGSDENLYEFAEMYADAVERADHVVVFSDAFNLAEMNLSLRNRRSTPFLSKCPMSFDTWFTELKDTRLLVVSPFVKTFEKQVLSEACPLGHGVSSRELTKAKISLVWQCSYNSSCGAMPHSNWCETYASMCDEIREKKDLFDVAVLSCGAYGLPLCTFVREELNKTAIYVGGELQLWFCVRGARWENRLRKIFEKRPELERHWCRPSTTEKPKNFMNLEQGCYW